MKNGKDSGIVQSQQSQVENLTWFATCTHSIKSIHYINPAPATHEKSKDG
jgi:hypothetical protein|tara:strand:+ start:2162 stop:2311 length:150 start_codon:yes stop_codon:yes gene_type:complete